MKTKDQIDYFMHYNSKLLKNRASYSEREEEKKRRINFEDQILELIVISKCYYLYLQSSVII